jgi:hypothetical protein
LMNPRRFFSAFFVSTIVSSSQLGSLRLCGAVP